MRMFFCARLRNVLVGEMISMSGTLVLEVLLVVVGQVILPSGWLSLCHTWYEISQPVVNESILLNSINVHVCNGGKVCLFLLCFGIPAPVCLNSLHVPLIHHCHDVLALYIVQFSEDSFIPLIDKNSLLVWSSLTEQSHQEVDATTIDRLSKGLSSSHVQGIEEIIWLRSPAWCNLKHISEALPKISVRIEIWLEP